MPATLGHSVIPGVAGGMWSTRADVDTCAAGVATVSAGLVGMAAFDAAVPEPGAAVATPASGRLDAGRAGGFTSNGLDAPANWTCAGSRGGTAAGRRGRAGTLGAAGANGLAGLALPVDDARETM